MKKFVLLILIVAVGVACQSPQVEDQPIGYDISDKGVERTLYGGDIATVTVWEDYVKAHNENDLEAIRSFNAEGFKAWGPRGEFIDGSDAHIEFLSNWFAQNNPKWKSKYFIANEFTDKDGKLQQWVTSGHYVTLTVDEKEITVNQVHDALIADGKVQRFYVYERAEPATKE